MGTVRADRLLRILLLLQANGRMRAQELADRLEVTVRTVQRDMEALGAAGVPIYATRGRGGGWQLLGDYRTTLTGMTAAEALALVVGRPPKLLEDLTLRGDGDAALIKLIAEMAPEVRTAAEHAQQRVHVDLSRWGERQAPDPSLARLQEATWDDRLVDVRYGASRSRFTLAPVGLVAKGMVWYLVASRDGTMRTYRVERFTDVQLLDERFERPAGFDLATHWQEVSVGLADRWPSYFANLRLRGQGERRVRWSTRVLEHGEPDDRGWVNVTIDTESLNEARSVVLSLGPDVEVLDPEELREAVAEDALAIARHNGIGEGG